MSDCAALSDRMPAVVHGGDAWRPLDFAHLASCAECAAEWRLVQAGAALGGIVNIDTTRVAAQVVARLAAEPPTSVALPRLPWRAVVPVVLAVAAACIVLIAYVPHRPATGGRLLADTAALGLLPELQGLDESDLQSVLATIAPTGNDVTPGMAPHLDDLTDAELEQLLRAEGGE